MYSKLHYTVEMNTFFRMGWVRVGRGGKLEGREGEVGRQGGCREALRRDGFEMGWKHSVLSKRFIFMYNTVVALLFHGGIFITPL